MESKTKYKQTNETIREMAKYIFHLDLKNDANSVIELKEGWFNVAYLVKLENNQDVILKIAPEKSIPVMTYEKNMMSREVHFLKKAKVLSIPTPTVYGYDNRHTICSSDYFFMEKLKGENYEKIKHALDEVSIQRIDKTIGKLTKLWNQDTNSELFGYPYHETLQATSWQETFLKMVDALLLDGLRNQVDLGYDYKEIKKVFTQYQDTLSEVTTPHFIHWDCWDSNVFIQDKEVSGILDFERGLFGDPLFEALFRMKNPNQLAGYGKESFNKNESIRMRMYDAYLGLVMAIEDSYRHYDKPDIKNWGLYQIDQFMKEFSIKH